MSESTFCDVPVTDKRGMAEADRVLRPAKRADLRGLESVPVFSAAPLREAVERIAGHRLFPVPFVRIARPPASTGRAGSRLTSEIDPLPPA